MAPDGRFRLLLAPGVRAVGTFAACLFQGKPREKFSEPHEVNRYPISRDDQAHGNNNQQDAATYPQREGLPEDHHPEEDGRDRFQGTEDCRRCRTDVLDGAGCTQNEIAVGKTASASRFPHRYHLSGTWTAMPKSSRTT